MMNFNDRIKAETVLEDVFKMIDQNYIYRRIDQPVEKAAQNYTLVHPETLSHHLFNNIIGDYVMHLFNSGHLIKIESKTTAITEAVSIIEMGYQGSSNGYHAALLDAMNQETNGLGNVFQQIKEAIISILKGRYIQWVYDTKITSLEWSTRVAVAEVLLDQCKPYLPSNMQYVSPVQMADDIPLLINTIQASEEKIRGLTGINVL